jgi:predicted molibdopterin-dependent oxidoreductase YjgC
MGDEIRVLFIDGENTLLSDPDYTHSKKKLESLDFMVLIDIFRTETAELADVVLPATAWGETDGVFTNTERRVQRVRQAVPPPGVARPDWWIISQIARRLGFAGFEYTEASEVFNEFCSVSPLYGGLDWERIEHGEYQWPVPDKSHPGTPRLHEDGFPIGRGRFKCITYRGPAESINEAYPVWLTTGRRLTSYHTHTQTGRSSGIDYLLPEEVLEVHPDDVAAWGLRDGGWCAVSSPRGTIKVKVQANDRSPRGTVFTSFAFGETKLNTLTGSGYDPVTSTAEVKVCAVRVEPA